tara:strand:+ start:3472 stop:4224 length:753 start_codon:yes stop_codon:yes gene_type:complete
MEDTGVISYSSYLEKDTRNNLQDLLKTCPIPEDQILSNLGLFLGSKDLSRILLMHHLYQLIIDVPGVIMDFGTRWGQNMAIFIALRGIFEPFNRHRKIIGFDTFEGFPYVVDEDGNASFMKSGNLSVTKDYLEYLECIMACQEDLNPLSHIKKYELVPGNACHRIDEYLKERTETIVSFAYFDFDLYEPTKKCLEAILPRVVKGSVLAFDELNDQDSPGETLALMEVCSLNQIELKRYRYASRVSYFVVS